MHDFGSPVAQNIQPPNPNQGLEALSAIMNIRKAQQDLQLQRQNMQLNAAAIQQQNQAMNTRQQAQLWAQKGADAQGNSLLDEQGQIDPAKFATSLTRYDPINGTAMAEGVIRNAQEMATMKGAMLGLGEKQRNVLQAPLQAAALNPTPEAMNAANDTITQWVKENPQLESVGATAQKMLASIQQQQDPEMRAKMAQQFSAMLQPGQSVNTQPTPTAVNTGQSVMYGSQAPGVAGGAFTPSSQVGLSVPVGQQTSVGFNPATGQPYAMHMTPSGTDVSITGVGVGGAGNGTNGPAGTTAQAQPSGQTQWQRLGMFPTPQQAASASQAAQEADHIRAIDSNPTTGYAPTKQVYQNLINLVKQNPSIGPGSQTFNRLTGALTPLGLSPNANMQEVSAYLDRLALQNSSAAGATDMARHMAANAAGSTEMSPQALMEKLRFGAATLEASHAYRQGLDATIGTNNSNPIAKHQFDAEWSKNADINAFRLMSAKQSGDQEGYQQTLQQIKSMPAAQREQVIQKMQNLNLLVNGKLPND